MSAGGGELTSALMETMQMALDVFQNHERRIQRLEDNQ